jgi:tetratricopeptide (TPR) repeat protein
MGSLGGNTSMQRDPSTALMGCVLRASLPGFRSESVNLSNHRALDNPDVGTIILHRLGNVEGQTISVTSALAPKDAKKAYEKALADVKKEKWDDAQRELEKATSVYPKYAAAWYELGRVQQRQDKIEDAKKSYAQALAADSKYLRPYQQIAIIAVREQRWEDVKQTTARLVSLDPVDYPDAWYYNAVANYQLKQFDAAEKSAREGLKIDTDHTVPRTNQLLAVLLANKEDYAGAAQSLKNYLQIAPHGPEAETVKKQLAMVEQKLQASAGTEKQ